MVMKMDLGNWSAAGNAAEAGDKPLAIEARGLIKRFDGFTAVDGIDLTVEEGAIYGILGPNGAGKTTTLRMLLGIIDPDKGVRRVLGHDSPHEVAHAIGYLPEERGLYPAMRAYEAIAFVGALRGLPLAEGRRRARLLLEEHGLGFAADRQIRQLSKGMAQQVQILGTLVHKPRLVVFDEPFSGLDPVNTNLIKQEIHHLQGEGVSIIFSTHRMEQVEEICEHIVLINQGRNVLEGKVSDIKNKFKKNLYRIQFSGELPAGLETRAQIVEQTPSGITMQVGDEAESNKLLQYLLQHGVVVRSFNEILPTLNEIFIRQVKGGD